MVTIYDADHRIRIFSRHWSDAILLRDRKWDILGIPWLHIQKRAHMPENHESSIEALRGVRIAANPDRKKRLGLPPPRAIAHTIPPGEALGIRQNEYCLLLVGRE